VAPSVLLIEDDARLAEILGHHMDGLEVCRQLRAKSAIPVLMLTARSEAMDRVVGLEICADDYLPKRKDASDRQHLRDAGDDSSFRWTTEETIIQQHGIGPLSVNYLKPAHDGRHQ
jgi:CheY-like chemotaxis protein